jgi:hypothetical protein
MKLSNAYVCSSCKEVSDGAPRGRCTVCGSESVYPLGWIERSQEERNRWFALIAPKRGARRNTAVDLSFLKLTI